jgi:hypothetical protein
MSTEAAVDCGLIESFTVWKTIVDPVRLSDTGDIVVKDCASTWHAYIATVNKAIQLASGFSIVAIHCLMDDA